MKFIAFLLLMSLTFSCSNDEAKTESDNRNQVKTEVVPNSDATDAEDAKEFTGSTCKELEQSSWDRNIRNLAEKRCMDCHNAKFAWNGFQLHTYQLFKENSEASRERLASGDLTIDIFLYEIQIFNDWFDAGMPQTEEDCAQP